jgi:hypothetical protein
MAYEYAQFYVDLDGHPEVLDADGTWSFTGARSPVKHRQVLGARLETGTESLVLRVEGPSAKWQTRPLPRATAPDGQAIRNPVAYFLNHVARDGWEVVWQLKFDASYEFLLRRRHPESR